MSIASISGASSFVTGGTNPFQQRRQDFQALQSALANGDLSGAQSAFSALQQLFQVAAPGFAAAASTSTAGASGVAAVAGAAATSGSSSGPAASSPLSGDWTALGQALSSGNLQGAQAAFAQLQSDFKSSLQAAAGGVGTLNVRGASAPGAVHHGAHHRHHGGGGVAGAAAVTGTANDPDGDGDGSAGSVLSSTGSTVSSTSSTGSLLNVTA